MLLSSSQQFLEHKHINTSYLNIGPALLLCFSYLLASPGGIEARADPRFIDKCGGGYCLEGVDYCKARAAPHYDVDPHVFTLDPHLPNHMTAPPGTLQSAFGCIRTSYPPDAVWCEVSEDGSPLIYACLGGIQGNFELNGAGLVSARTVAEQKYHTPDAPSLGDASIASYFICLTFSSTQNANHRYFGVHVHTTN